MTKTKETEKLAKSLRKIIVVIVKVNKWPRPLTKEIQRLNPSLIISEEDSIYCVEFNSDNYESEMLAKIREALQQRETKIRETRNKFMYPKINKIQSGKRKRGRNKKY